MKLEPQSLYVQLGRSIEQIPHFSVMNQPNTEQKLALSRAYALCSQVLDHEDMDELKRATSVMATNKWGYETFNRLLLRAFAMSEMFAPDVAQGAFIAAGNTFDAMAAVGKVLSSAANNVLLVDPYMDEKALFDFALLAPAGIRTRLLADNKHYKPTLEPAAKRWVAQYGTDRPLEARLTPDRALHDRLIIVDDATVWVLTQSLNAIAARSPATIVRSDGDAANLKVDAYRALWDAATVL